MPLREPLRTPSIVLAALLLVPACRTARVLTNQCVAPYVAGSATLDVSGVGETRRYTVAGEGGRVGSERHDLIQAALLGGEVPPDTGITWVLANPEGVRLVVAHRARLTAGERLVVGGVTGRRDWGTSLPPPPGAAAAAFFMPNDMAGQAGTRMTGTIEVLRVAPLELRLDLRPEPPASGGTSPGPAVTGVVRFRRAGEERPCFS